MTSTPPDEQSSSSSTRPSPGMFPAQARLWDRVTVGLKWAVVFAVAGFFVSITYDTSTTSEGTQTDCTYIDVAQLALGLATAIAVALGCRQEFAKKHDRLKLGHTQTLGVAAVLLLVATFHVIVGFGLIGGPCN